MFAKLTGTVDSLYEDWLILDVGGVGYRVSASVRTLDGLRGRSGTVSLAIETQVREDAITLFGFASSGEQDMFRLLTSVQGVGAKVALAIQSVLTTDQITLALSAQDKTAISRANGVGPKLAARICNELKDKVTATSFAGAAQITATASRGAASNSTGNGGSSLMQDLSSALANLGYSASEAHRAAATVVAGADEDASLESLVPKALKELMG